MMSILSPSHHGRFQYTLAPSNCPTALGSSKATMILPEVIDESKWWQGKHRYIDPKANMFLRLSGTLRLEASTTTPTSSTPKNSNHSGIFLNPKWKGKIEARDVRSSGTGTS